MSALNQQESTVLEAALKLPPKDRAVYLDEACGNDAQLRQRVEALPNPRLSGERQEELTNMCSRGVEFFTRPLQIGALTVWNQRNLFM